MLLEVRAPSLGVGLPCTRPGAVRFPAPPRSLEILGDKDVIEILRATEVVYATTLFSGYYIVPGADSALLQFQRGQTAGYQSEPIPQATRCCPWTSRLFSWFSYCLSSLQG